MKTIYCTILLLLICKTEMLSNNPIRFFENKGQFNCKEEFKAEIGNSNIYFGKKNITYNILESKDNHEHNGNEEIKGHCYQVEFINSNTDVKIKASSERLEKYNYFIGSDISKWVSNVRLFNELLYENIYQGIDIHYYGYGGTLKYDFILNPGSNANQIEINYNGQSSIKLINGKLLIKTSINNIIEEKPYAYQLDVNGNKVEVVCNYVLKGTKLSFQFPNGYDRTKKLIIDPTVIFSTYSSSTALLSADGATYDSQGNLYVAAGTFGPVYQGTPGAFTTSISTGNGWNIVIEKYASNGTTQLYGTLIGGTAGSAMGMPADDYPYSLFCDSNDNLFILATSTSTNYPTTSGCYDNTFASSGGFGLPVADYVVSKLNSTGSSLLASTYLGGTGSEGGTFQTYVSTIYVDGSNNVFVSGLTESTNYPTTAGVIQTALSGTSDGVVTKLNNNLSSLIWSTYIGGSSTEDACDVKIAPNGNIYICGNTSSTNFPGVSGGLNPTSFGNQDGFVTVINSTATSLIQSTYLGTSAKDKAKFIQIDPTNNIYIFGCTSNSSYPTTSGAYNQPGTYNYFIHKINSGLTSTIFSCCLGGNTNSSANINEFVPTAFGIDPCNNVHFSGSNLNGGLPTTSNAITTSSKSIFLGSIDNTGASLLFGSYYGGSVSGGSNVGSHIHESTNNRFNPNGVLFHSECYLDNAYTLQNQVSSDNNTSNNAASFKIDFSFATSSYSASIPAGSITNPSCGSNSGSASVSIIGGSGNFTYSWSPSGGTQNSASGLAAGVYTVTITDLNPSCGNGIQTVTVSLTNTSTTSITVSSSTICAGGTATLTASGANSYTWSPAIGLSSTTGSIVTATSNSNTTYTVIGSVGTCTGSSIASITIGNGLSISSNSANICSGSNATLTATGATSYTWSPSIGLSTTTSSVVVANPSVSTIYTVSGSAGSCTGSTITTVSVTPTPTLSINSATICSGNSATITVNGATNYSWSPSIGLSSSSGSTVICNITSNTIYTVIGATNGCTSTVNSSITVNSSPTISVNNPTICAGETTSIVASGAISYTWNSGATTVSISVSPTISIIYTISGTNSNGCVSSNQSTVSVIQNPIITSSVVSNVLCNGQSTGSITLQVSNAQTYTWSPNVSSNNTALNLNAGIYTCTISSGVNCVISQSFTVTEPTILTSTFTSTNTSCNYCDGAISFTTSGGTGDNYLYNWLPNGLNQNNNLNLCAGVYSITVKDLNNCSNIYTINILPSTGATATVTTVDNEIKLGTSTQLNSGNGINYSWYPTNNLSCIDCSNPLASPTEDIVYCVEITDVLGCKDTACVEIRIECGNVYIPTAFSPNNDGHNDVLCVYGNCITQMKLQIFDRWGILVFESEDSKICWDGKYKGVSVNSGVFVYDFNATTKNRNTINKKGNITVVK
ncbi:MAG: gliding motility-associated C-terminal domain-containing protein [Bacteroidota bacterium]